jgi:apolipoprotein N-acyltransferase
MSFLAIIGYVAVAFIVLFLIALIASLSAAATFLALVVAVFIFIGKWCSEHTSTKESDKVGVVSVERGL